MLPVVLAPLPFGSVETPWVALWCVLIAASLLLADTGRATRAQLQAIAAVLVVFAAVVGVVLLQIWSFPFDPLISRARELLGADLPAPTAAEAVVPLLSLGNSLLLVMVFCRFILLAGAREDAEAVFKVIAWAGLVYAVAGILSFLFDPTHILWKPKLRYVGNLTGTFVNRNTAATFFGSISVLWLLLLMSEIKNGRSRLLRPSERLWLLLSGRDAAFLWIGLAAMLCLAATAATGSRAGFIFTLSVWFWSMICYWGIGIRDLMRRWKYLLALGGVVAIVLEILANSVTVRINALGLEDEARFAVYAATWDLIQKNAWLGIGLGNFEAVFPSIRPHDINIAGVWDRAHSAPLELAVEIGLPVAGLVAMLWLWIVASLMAAGWRSRSPVVIAGGCIGVLGMLHGLVDFSVQIPGYAALFAAMTATGLGLAKAPDQTGPARA